MGFLREYLGAVLVLLATGCGKKDAGDATSFPDWTPVLTSCAEEQKTSCFLADPTSKMIWSQTFVTPASQRSALAYCEALNMRLPTFREYAIAAKNGMLDVPQLFPAFGDVESLLWTAEKETYIAFGNNTATKRQGSAPARFKCVSGDKAPSVAPRGDPEPVPNETAASIAHANNCRELRTLTQCSNNELCVWTYRGCLGIEGVME